MDENQEACDCPIDCQVNYTVKAQKSMKSRGRPIIGADIKHFYDYRYRPFSKNRFADNIFFFIMQTNILFTGDIIYWWINNTGEMI